MNYEDYEKALKELEKAREDQKNALDLLHDHRVQVEKCRAELTAAQVEKEKAGTEADSAYCLLSEGIRNLSVDPQTKQLFDEAELDFIGGLKDPSPVVPVTKEVTKQHRDDHEIDKPKAEVLLNKVDSAELNYIVERQGNINCFQCYLYYGDGYKYRAPQSFRLLSGRDRLIVMLMNPGSSCEKECLLKFPNDIDIKNVRPLLRSDHLYIRIPMINQSTSASFVSSHTRLSEEETSHANFYRICCRSCSIQLVKTLGCIQKVLPLPSSKWEDSMEFWGAPCGSFAHLPRGDIEAKQSQILLAESHIRMHASDLTENLVLATDGKSICQGCLAPLGTWEKKTVRLLKHRVVAMSENDEKALTRYTVDVLIGADMLEAAENEGAFRFRVLAGEKACCRLKLIGWDSELAVSSSKGIPVLKVVYEEKIFDAEEGVQDLHYSEDDAFEILTRLRKSSDLLPPSVRLFHGSTLGFLFW